MDAIKNIIHNISSGDEKSFRRFFDIYKNKIYTYLLSIVKLHEIAEELTSDVFLKIWEKRVELERINDIDAYLFIIAKNKALDFLRVASRNKGLQALIEKHFFDTTNIRTIQNTAVELIEKKELLNEILGCLTEQRRKIITLSHIDGYSHDEISDNLRISKNTVKNTIVQTIKVLKKGGNRPEIQIFWIVLALSYL